MAEQPPKKPVRRTSKSPDPVKNGSTEPTNGERLSANAVRFAGLITSLIKLGGLAIAGNEALFQDPPRDPIVFAVAAFMMAGAQGLDSLINSFLGPKK